MHIYYMHVRVSLFFFSIIIIVRLKIYWTVNFLLGYVGLFLRLGDSQSLWHFPILELRLSALQSAAVDTMMGCCF